MLAADPARQYYGFEPQLGCCFYIERFVQLNGIRNVHVVPLALSNAEGMIELFWDHPGDLTASVLVSQESGDEVRSSSSWVAARKGDALVSELRIEEVAAIKIDVEGFEYEVLSGLTETIAKQRPAIIFEVLTNFIWGKALSDDKVRANRQGRANQIFQFLSDLDYCIYRIDGQGREHKIKGFELDVLPTAPFVNDGRDYIARPQAFRT